MHRPFSITIAALFSLLIATAPTAAQQFRFVGIPDTQNYSESFPNVFYGQTSWVAANAEALGIRFVSHYGDYVQNGDSLAEWAVADTAMATIDASGIPWGGSAGNHDITPSGSFFDPYIPGNYVAYVGPSRFANASFFRGSSPSGMSSYQVFDGAGLQFLVLHIECDGALAELEWAQGVLDHHRDKPVIMTTHRYLQDAEEYTFGVPAVPSGRYPSIWYLIESPYTPGGIESEQIWDWFVRRNPNILMVNCGHFHEEFRQVSQNLYGDPVHEVLADYQDDPNGGDGWLRLMTFDLGLDQIDVDSYSTLYNSYRTADESDFTLSVDFDRYFTMNPTVVVHDGIAGYAGTVDTWIDEDRPNTSFGSSDVIIVDDDTTNSIFSDQLGQGLIRFEGLFGSGIGQIPYGAQIVSAKLTVELDDDINAPFSDPDLFVHAVLVPWDENSTWNSLGGGLQSSELGPQLAVLAGDNDPNFDYARHLDVTAAVQAWSSGSPNYGFAIIPEIVGGNDDGIEIRSSESSNALLRPRLEIVFASDCGYFPYGAGASAANVLDLYGLGLPAVGGAIEVAINGAPTAPWSTISAGYTFAPANLPLFGGQVLIDPVGILASTTMPSPNGRATWLLDVPADPAFIGGEIFFQAIAPDGTMPGGWALSNGLRVRLCQ